MEDENEEEFAVCDVGEDSGEPDKATVWDVRLDERVFAGATKGEAEAFLAAITRYKKIREDVEASLVTRMERGTIVLVVTTVPGNLGCRIEAFAGDGKDSGPVFDKFWAELEPGHSVSSWEVDLKDLSADPIRWMSRRPR